MKVLSFTYNDNTPRIGILWDSNEIIDVKNSCKAMGSNLFDGINKLEELIVLGDEGISKLKQFLQELRGLLKEDKNKFDSIKENYFLNLEKIGFLAPTYNPQKIVCLGRNFVDHAKEGGKEAPKQPMIWGKFNSSIIAHKENIILPKISEKVDVEIELVAVIGKKGKNILEDKALDYVFGYMIGNDVSARDFQYMDVQFTRAKTMDTFTPLGPWIVTKDEIPDTQNLDLELKVNGKTWQKSNTKNMSFQVPFTISYLSKSFTFMPGDLIFMGTPAGVGHYQNPSVYLKAGDIVSLTIDKIGTLVNPVIDEK
ncbi:MAG: fumarylacetoacetate hydrolase family protein [Candidatus Heimdallarchaeota archaeon]